MKAREQELQKLRDGQLKAAKKTGSTAEAKSDAFDNYIKMFYDLRKIEVSLIHSLWITIYRCAWHFGENDELLYNSEIAYFVCIFMYNSWKKLV